MAEPTSRSTVEVLGDHWEQGQVGSVEDDLARNYGRDIVCFTRDGLFHGHDGIRELNERLLSELGPDPRFEYSVQLTHRDVGFLEWTAESSTARVTDGADSYVVRDGLIVAQTIHYTVEPHQPA